MAFDAAALVEALEPPSIRVPRRFLPGAKTYTGRILSHREFLPFIERFQALDAEELDDAEVEELFRDYLEAIDIPPRVVLRLPPSIMLQALSDFLRCQRRASTVAAEARTRPSGGGEPSRATGPERPSVSRTRRSARERRLRPTA